MCQIKTNTIPIPFFVFIFQKYEVRKMEIKEINSSSAERQVLGAIMQKPELLKSYSLNSSDFTFRGHEYMFLAIKSLASNSKSITYPDILEYLEEAYPSKGKYLEKCNYLGFTQELLLTYNPENIAEYYGRLKKFSLLRDLYSAGIDITEMYDPDELDPEVEDKKIDFFDELNVNGMLMHYENKLRELREKYKQQTATELSFYKIPDLPASQVEEKHLIKDFMLENTFNSIIAGAKVGKSQLAYQMAFCVQNGIDFLNLPVTQGDVLYVDFELRPNAIKKRFERLKEFYNMPDAQPYEVIALAEIYGEGNTTLEQIVDLIRRKKAINPNIKLCIFDCYYSFCEGDANAERDTKTTLGKIKVLTKDMAVVYVHHTNKTGFTNATSAIYAAGGSGVHGKIVDETYVLNPKANETVEIINTGRDWSDRLIPCIKNEDTLWFYKADDAEYQALNESRIGIKEKKKPITREELQEKFPDIYSFIEKNSTDEFGVTLAKIKKEFPHEDGNSLKKKGFIFTGRNARTDGVPCGRILIPN